MFGDGGLGDRLKEAGPACAGIEFRIGREERLPAGGAVIDALGMGVPVLAGESLLGAGFASDAILLGCEELFPLGFGFFFPVGCATGGVGVIG